MKRIFLSFGVCIATLSVAVAQQVTVSDGIALREEIAYDILGEWSGQLLLLRDQAVAWKVAGFNQKMEQVWEKDIGLDRRRPQIIDVINEKRGFSIAYTYRQELNLFFKIHRYDPAANLTDSVTLFNQGQELFPITFYSVISENRSKMLVYKVEDFKAIHAFAIDLDSLSLMWEVQLAPDGMDYFNEFQQMVVDNEGNMFCILNKDGRNVGKNRFEVFVYGPYSGLAVQRLDILMSDKLCFDVQFAFDNLNRQLIAGGLYSEDNLGRAAGPFYLRLPLGDQENGVLQFHELDDKFVSAFMGKNFNAKNRGITETTAREIVLRKDGGILLIGERERIYERNLPGGRFDMAGGRFIVDYYLDDLFIISFNPDGSLHWQEILHKKQYSQDDDAVYSSYFLLKTPANLRLFFNDEIKHENTVSEYVVSPIGHTDRFSVMNTDKQRLKLRFRDAVQVSSSELIVPSERRNTLKLVRIRY
jgi:hypothetical protein